MKLKKYLLQLLTFSSYAFLFLLIGISIFRPDIIRNLLEQLRAGVLTLGFWNWIILALSAFLESVPIIWGLLPWQTIVLIIWWVLAKHYPLFTLLIVVVFTLLGNLVGFWLGKKYGVALIQKHWAKIGIWMTDIKYLKKAIKKYWAWMIVLGKFHGNFRSFVPFVVGMGDFALKPFVLWNIVAAFLRAIVMIGVGLFLFEYYEVVFKYFGWWILVLMLVFGVFVYYKHPEAFKEYIKEKEKELTTTKTK